MCNRVFGCLLTDIGNLANPGDGGYGGLDLVNSRSNEIRNNHFVDVQNASGSEGLMHAVYLAHGSRENEIVAVVEGDVDAMAIRQALTSHVETYALPRRIVAVDKIPMSAAGKYDRQAAEELFAGKDKSPIRYLSTNM